MIWSPALWNFWQIWGKAQPWSTDLLCWFVCAMFLQLELVRGLVSESVDDQSRLEALTYSAIYLKVFPLAPYCALINIRCHRNLMFLELVVWRQEYWWKGFANILNLLSRLQWIYTGQIPCFEDGGHHRPNKHAEISREIFRVIERTYYGKNTSAQVNCPFPHSYHYICIALQRFALLLTSSHH